MRSPIGKSGSSWLSLNVVYSLSSFLSVHCLFSQHGISLISHSFYIKPAKILFTMTRDVVKGWLPICPPFCVEFLLNHQLQRLVKALIFVNILVFFPFLFSVNLEISSSEKVVNLLSSVYKMQAMQSIEESMEKTP